MKITYRGMNIKESVIVVNLVRRVFNEFIAPQYSPEGIAEFEKFISVQAFANRMQAGNFVLVAEREKQIIGIIEMRDGNHVALLFVDNTYQRQGIAKGLLEWAIRTCETRNPEIRYITVNASPNAYSAYRRMGFTPIGEEKTVNGIRFVPMALLIDRKKKVMRFKPK